MSTFTVTFDTDNAAFDGDNFGAEIARILTVVAADVQPAGQNGLSPDRSLALRDSNGNTVGYATWEA